MTHFLPVEMSVIFLLIPLSIAVAAFFLAAFIWAVRSGQYEDTLTPAMRVLLEEPAANAVAGSQSKTAVSVPPHVACDAGSNPLLHP